MQNIYDLLSEWEQEYGTNKGGCFGNTESMTTQERIDNIYLMRAAKGVSLAEDFEYIATLIGLDVSVYSGYDASILFPLLVSFDTIKEARNHIVVDLVNVPDGAAFTYTFPITFGIQQTATLQCLFDILKPAHTKILYINE